MQAVLLATISHVSLAPQRIACYTPCVLHFVGASVWAGRTLGPPINYLQKA